MIRAVCPMNKVNINAMKYLLESSQRLGFTVDVIGIGKRFSWLDRMEWFKEYLSGIQDNPIVCFTDAYDVFYVDSLEVIRQKFLELDTEILWSTEKWCSHHILYDNEFYEARAKTNYRYINAGTFMGYKTALLQLFTDILDALKDPGFINELVIGFYNNDIRGSDQTWISHYLVKNFDKYNIKLDYYCTVFYLPCGDWSNIDECIDSNLMVKETGMKPSIIHVPWKSRYEYIMLQLYQRRFGNSNVENKKYSWEGGHTIQFLEGGKMKAFGEGRYIQLDHHIIQAFFGGREHMLIFNDNYTSFTSIRRDDNEIIKGSIV